ncbi:MAG: WecB/TagA/CpsF family glycosyltransferase [Prochloraceae cyanobacterium]|nr:WecB/TagA/CpsF family glycosyltransferase [Prochloraceae cyanobacterium]
MQTVNFLGRPLLTGNLEEIANWLISLVQEDSQPPQIVSHVNANNYYHLSKNPIIYDALVSSSYLLFDGIGMKLSACLLNQGWLPDLNGTDLFPLVMARLERAAIPVYFLGADECSISNAVKRTCIQWPRVRVVGFSSGYFSADHEDKIVRAVNASGAKLLLVGRGFPRQELFSLRNRHQFEVSLIWNVGGLFDFVSGAKPRAPVWLRQQHLEWLFRLTLEPRRLWHRTFVVGPWLLNHILIQKFFNRGDESEVKLRGMYDYN